MNKPWRKRLIITVLVLLVVWGGVAWYFSSKIIALPTAETTHNEITITALTGTGDTREISLRGPAGDDALAGIVGGLDLAAGGFIRLDAVQSSTKTTITRQATLIEGNWPAIGTRATGSKYGWPADPQTAIGGTVVSPTIPSDSGAIPAWVVPGQGTTWVLGVHGLGAQRREVFGILHDAHTVGLPVAAIEYRGAVDGPKPSDGNLHFGLTEWKDVQAAVNYLKTTYGAQHFVLAGFSMGGEIVTQFLRNSPDRAAVPLLILDAPLLDFDATLRLRVKEMGIPGWVSAPLLASAKEFADLRAGLDFGKLDAVQWLASQPTPILLFHGSTDTSVPISSSRELARLDPHVSYHECVAEHVRCWNAGPATYDAAVIAFLRGL